MLSGLSLVPAVAGVSRHWAVGSCDLQLFARHGRQEARGELARGAPSVLAGVRVLLASPRVVAGLEGQGRTVGAGWEVVGSREV